MKDTLNILTKNGRINSEIRQILMLTELELLSTSWDVVCFSETRCISYDFILQEEYRVIFHFDGNGVAGVAIIIHQRHVKNIFLKITVDNRALAVDIKIGSKIMRIISIYAPHAGYHWNDFILFMDDISNLLMEAQDQHKIGIIACDFNLSLYHGDRGFQLDDLCHQFNIHIANGSGNGSDDQQ